MLHRAARRYRPALLIVAVLALLAGIAVAVRGTEPNHRLGLFTTLPILWSEAPDVADLLNSSDAPHWVRAELARYGTIEPLDTLSGLDRVDRLVMAQPRPLSPDENVALDNWVRAGGHLVLFADPLLTEESAYALGDRRRPQDVVMLSPILRRWGLELLFDEVQPAGERLIEGLPVNLAGRLAPVPAAACRSRAEGIVVSCMVEKGRVTVLADAAVLERDDANGARQKALVALLDDAFPDHQQR
ncbi:MAG TPA: ABC transporter [Novosphingobium sp.]|nr:ABC transporter [Novosphingobium sp.]